MYGEGDHTTPYIMPRLRMSVFHSPLSLYIYIHIYICVCVCVCQHLKHICVHILSEYGTLPMAFILILFPGKYCISSGLSCISAFLWHATFRDECHVAILRWFCRHVYCINLSSDLLQCLLITKNPF
jgi:hypothetical protein